ncbi:MAG: response regulator transcription factor [Bacillota bacterium]|nr:response regulator transcription factor [Bacillota bacterium]
MKKILVAEDDVYISNLISDYLKASGYKPVVAQTGDAALRLFASEHPDMALLDIMLPGVDGFELCRLIRAESKIPIIMVSSKKEDSDKILSLALGADDYVEKPFSARVLMAKISALLRRVDELGGTTPSGEIAFEDITLNPVSRIVTKSGREIELSKIEFDILHLLLGNINQVMSRERIFDNVWGADDFGDISTVTVHIKKIRDKIETDAAKPEIIQTIRGVGYVIRGRTK